MWTCDRCRRRFTGEPYRTISLQVIQSEGGLRAARDQYELCRQCLCDVDDFVRETPTWLAETKGP